VPAPVGVPLAILTVLPAATVVALVAMLMVSTKPFAVPVLFPIAIVRAVAGLMLPNEMAVTRVLLPMLSVAIPAVPTPDKILTAEVAAVAPFAMLIVSPAVDWPKVIELVLVVEPINIELGLVVPMFKLPLVAVCNDRVEPPWISVVVPLVLPTVTLVALVLPSVIEPLVPVVIVPTSIEMSPELPLVVELPLLIVSEPVLRVALPERKVLAPESEFVPDTSPERTVNAVELVDAAVWSAVFNCGA